MEQLNINTEPGKLPQKEKTPGVSKINSTADDAAVKTKTEVKDANASGAGTIGKSDETFQDSNNNEDSKINDTDKY